MHNVEYKVAGDKLVITVDISQTTVGKAPDSKTGKTRLVASTGGAQRIAGCPAGLGDQSFALNVIAKP
jgi:hypothetical protein